MLNNISFSFSVLCFTLWSVSMAFLIRFIAYFLPSIRFLVKNTSPNEPLSINLITLKSSSVMLSLSGCGPLSSPSDSCCWTSYFASSGINKFLFSSRWRIWSVTPSSSLVYLRLSLKRPPFCKAFWANSDLTFRFSDSTFLRLNRI